MMARSSCDQVRKLIDKIQVSLVAADAAALEVCDHVADILLMNVIVPKTLNIEYIVG